MGLSLRHWRPRHLLLAWLAYWLVALFVALGPALASIWRVMTDPEAHGSISASLSEGIFTLSVAQPTGVIWQGSASLMSIMLWSAGPPLVLFLLWLGLRSRAAEPALSSPPRP